MKDGNPIERAGRILFSKRGLVPVPFIAAGLWFCQPLDIVTGLGLLLVPLGVLIRLWAAIHMGPAGRSSSPVVRKLIYTGPYELTRNPLYIANTIIYVGLGLATAGLNGCGIAMCASAIHYTCIVRFEEQFLERRLGEIYRSYRNRVPRWVGEAAPVHAGAPKGMMDQLALAAIRSERTTHILASLVTVLVLIRAATVG